MGTEEEEPGQSYNLRKQNVKNRILAQIGQKGKFMTPERKKKLRVLLGNHAKKQIQEEQEARLKKRKEITGQRCGKPKDLTGLSDDQLRAICKEYQERIQKIESEKYDLEKQVEAKGYEIDETNIEVNNLRGKFVKPSLKKVTKHENKFANLQKKAAEYNFRQNLKVVKKSEFTIKDEDKTGKTKPEWTKGEKSKSICSEAPPESPTAKNAPASAEEEASDSASSSEVEE